MGINRKLILTFLSSIVLPGLAVIAFLICLLLVQLDYKKRVETLQDEIKKSQLPPKERLTLEKDLITLNNAGYGTLIQGLGGVFFIVTAFLSYRNLKATEEKQITERYSKSIEQLGADKIEIRLGGIYALERIAKDSPKDQWTIMEVLTSFVREKSPLQQSESHQEEEPETQENVIIIIGQYHSTPQQDKPQKITTDVQAVLTIIGRRDSTKDPQDKCLVLSAANLSRADLSGANLSRANLWAANLWAANLSRANLSRANFSRADLWAANLSGANLSGANLRGADLRGADLFGANLRKAFLSKANLNRANLWAAIFWEADFEGANLREANLWGADLSRANLSGANLSRANLREANLWEANLRWTQSLTSKQVKSAKNWEQAIYDADFRKELGFPSEPD